MPNATKWTYIGDVMTKFLLEGHATFVDDEFRDKLSMG